MRHQEKKYQVKSFTEIETLLNDKKAKKHIKKTSIHYYAIIEGFDVVKLVSKPDRNEIHILKEDHGKFSLTENILVESKNSGLKWLKDHGYNSVGLVKMENSNYEYKGGIIGLYIINDFLFSVILDYPAGEHEAIEKEFGLDDKDVIQLPYNKYLQQIGKLDIIRL